MKIAVCLHGYYGTVSTGDFSTSTGGREHIEEQILSKSKNVDFYVHCWQPETEDKVLSAYNPKNSVFENQIDFKPICDERGIYQHRGRAQIPSSGLLWAQVFCALGRL